MFCGDNPGKNMCYSLNFVDSMYSQISVLLYLYKLHIKVHVYFAGFAERPNDTIAALRSYFVLKCSATVSSTAISCTWKYNNNEMFEYCDHRSSLKLVAVEQGGLYTCEIMGNAGKPLTATANVVALCM